MKADKVKEKAMAKIFESRHSVRTAKRNMETENPELWGEAIAEYMRGGFDKASGAGQGSGGKVLNRPGKYFTKLWGPLQQRKLAIATEGMQAGDGTPLYGKINDFFDVMAKASIGQGKESATQSRGVMEKSLQGVAGKLNTSVNFLRQTASNFLLKGAQDRTFDRNSKRLLDLMQTPEGVDLIAKAKGYGPKTEKGIEAITTFLLMATESGAPKALEISKARKKPNDKRSKALQKIENAKAKKKVVVR